MNDVFDLQPPEWAKDDLDDATTNDSIEIEVVPDVVVAMEHLDKGPINFSEKS